MLPHAQPVESSSRLGFFPFAQRNQGKHALHWVSASAFDVLLKKACFCCCCCCYKKKKKRNIVFQTEYCWPFAGRSRGLIRIEIPLWMHQTERGCVLAWENRTLKLWSAQASLLEQAWVAWLGQLLLCAWQWAFINSAAEKNLSGGAVSVTVMRRGLGKGAEEG